MGARLLTRHSSRRATFLLAALALGFGCGRHAGEAARSSAEKALLERQIASLRAAVVMAEQGPLLSGDGLVVALDEPLVRDLLAARLPSEQVVGQRYKVRLERAEVSFAGPQGAFTLFGRATRLADLETFADLVLQGALDTPSLDSEKHALVAATTFDHVEARAATGAALSRGAAALVEELAQERIESFAGLAPRVEIPVRLDRSLSLKGLTSGPLTVEAGELPLQMAVARAFAAGGRLWILLDVSIGAWTPLARAPIAR